MSDTSRISNAYRRAVQAEREANKRISAASEREAKVQKESEKRISEIKQDHYERVLNSEAQNNAQLQHQKQNHEALLRASRKQFRKQLMNQEHSNDKTLQTIETRGENEIGKITRDTNNQIRKLQFNQENEVKRTNKKHDERMEELNSQTTRVFKDNYEGQIARIEGQRKNYLAELEREKANQSIAGKTVKDTFTVNLENQRKEYLDTLDRINGAATKSLSNIKSDYARSLAAYDTRQEDPFYQLVNLDAKISEDDGSYRLTASIPPHEAEQVQVSVVGDKIVLSGRRQMNEVLKDPSGRETKTASFQSFHEVFPAEKPINSKLIHREYDGDTLTVYFPKYGGVTKTPPYKVEKPEPTIAHRPEFPKNLTLKKEDS